MEKSLILSPYIRRRKCNEKTEICEKKEKQEALRRVSGIDVILCEREIYIFFFIFFITHTQRCVLFVYVCVCVFVYCLFLFIV